MWRSLFFALRFLTRLPLPEPEHISDKEIGYSVVYYPIVGLIIGIILAAVSWLLKGVSFHLHAALLLSFWIWITGALHLDGLADSVDAWAGGMGEAGRTLAIMKDPHVGPTAVVVLFSVLLVKFAALQDVIGNNWADLVLVPCVARAAVPAFFLTTPYVRRQGLGSALTQYLSTTIAIASLILTSVAVVVIFRWHGVWALVMTAILIFILRRIFLSRIGGLTGDTIGASVELIETLLLVLGAADL